MPEVKKSYSMYRDLKSLMLDKFIDVLCNDNLEALIIEGNPPQHELKQVWETMHYKYIEIVGGDDVADRLKLVRDITILSCKVERIEALLEVLSVAPSEGLFEQLYNLDYNIPTLPYNEPNIKVLGKLITAQMKLDVVKVKTLIQQMEEGQKKGEGEKMTEESFYKLIIDVSEMFKITIKESETSALAFATYLNKYKLKAEQLQKQNTKI